VTVEVDEDALLAKDWGLLPNISRKIQHFCVKVTGP
jgi:hypothetical protein